MFLSLSNLTRKIEGITDSFRETASVTGPQLNNIKKSLNATFCSRLFRQIATAVYYCHIHKICHRDLKLENVLLDDTGSAKVGIIYFLLSSSSFMVIMLAICYDIQIVIR